jgi:hypothetical protein
LEVVVAYGHAERNLVAATSVIADTVELLLRLPTLNDEQSEFLQDCAPEWLSIRDPSQGRGQKDFGADCVGGAEEFVHAPQRRLPVLARDVDG